MTVGLRRWAHLVLLFLAIGATPLLVQLPVVLAQAGGVPGNAPARAVSISSCCIPQSSNGSPEAIASRYWCRSGEVGMHGQRTHSDMAPPSDTIPPSAALASTASSPTSTSPIPMTVTFSEAVTGLTAEDVQVGNLPSAGTSVGGVTATFTVGDVTVTSGVVADFLAMSTTVYAFSVTPAGQGTVTVDVPAGVAQDAAGNGNVAATQYSIVYDSIPPTVTLTSTAASPTASSPIPMSVTFSEAIPGFSVEDVTVGNGSAGNFVAVSTTVYTFSITPIGQGTVTVDVAADVADDAAGNGNAEAAQYRITYSLSASTAGSPSWAWWLAISMAVALTLLGAFACWVMVSRHLRRE